MGTALTEEQLRLLKRFTRQDRAGAGPGYRRTEGRAARAGGGAQAMDREGELGFDARGLLRNEARLQADLRVASMPDGLDPDEIVARDPEEWKRLIENAKPIIEHVMEALAAGPQPERPKVKHRDRSAGAAADPGPAQPGGTRHSTAEAGASCSESTNAPSSDAGATARLRRARSRPARRRRKPKQAARARRSAVSLRRKRSRPISLALLFRKPELLYRLDRLLQQYGLATLAA